MAQQSARRGLENQGFPQCFEHALGDLDPARELPYRPAADHRCITGRTDGSIRLRATTIPKFSLATKGASTDGQRRRLQGSGRGGVSRSRPRGRRASGRRVWRNSRRDGVGKTRAFHSASSTLWVIWTRPANSHTGQQQTIAASQAGQMAASDYAPPQSRSFLLPRRGRPQMESGGSATCHLHTDRVHIEVLRGASSGVSCAARLDEHAM